MSIGGGLSQAIARAQSVDATALQIFTKNQVQWRCPMLTETEISDFREAYAASPLRYLCAHAGYLINLASDNPATRKKSIDLLALELSRAEALGCSCLVMHPGSPKGDGREVGIERIACGIAAAFEESATEKIILALENTAGQGATLGKTFSELGEIVGACDNGLRLGICLDTCHVFAGGYDLRDPATVDRMVREIDEALGLERLCVLHLNDSKHAVDSHKDRHEHIGEGEIGDRGFRTLLQYPKLRRIPGILETPKDAKTLMEDKENLARLRKLDSVTADR